MDVLVSLGTNAAYVYSVIAIWFAALTRRSRDRAAAATGAPPHLVPRSRILFWGECTCMWGWGEGMLRILQQRRRKSREDQDCERRRDPSGGVHHPGLFRDERPAHLLHPPRQGARGQGQGRRRAGAASYRAAL